LGKGQTMLFISWTSGKNLMNSGTAEGEGAHYLVWGEKQNHTKRGGRKRVPLQGKTMPPIKKASSQQKHLWEKIEEGRGRTQLWRNFCQIGTGRRRGKKAVAGKKEKKGKERAGWVGRGGQSSSLYRERNRGLARGEQMERSFA